MTKIKTSVVVRSKLAKQIQKVVAYVEFKKIFFSSNKTYLI